MEQLLLVLLRRLVPVVVPCFFGETMTHKEAPRVQLPWGAPNHSFTAGSALGKWTVNLPSSMVGIFRYPPYIPV